MKKTLNLKRLFLSVILVLLILTNMAMIFYNSSLNADSSDGISIDIATVIYNQAEKKTEKKAEIKETTNSTSNSVSESAQNIAEIETPEQKKLREEKEKYKAEQQELLRVSKILSYNTKLRELLHLFEFMSLSFLLVLLFLTLSMTKIHFYMFLSLALGALYALSDEVHQIFVDGRHFEIDDLLLDFTGVAAGVLLGCVMFTLLRRFLVDKKH